MALPTLPSITYLEELTDYEIRSLFSDLAEIIDTRQYELLKTYPEQAVFNIYGMYNYFVATYEYHSDRNFLVYMEELLELPKDKIISQFMKSAFCALSKSDLPKLSKLVKRKTYALKNAGKSRIVNLSIFTRHYARGKYNVDVSYEILKNINGIDRQVRTGFSRLIDSAEYLQDNFTIETLFENHLEVLNLHIVSNAEMLEVA